MAEAQEFGKRIMQQERWLWNRDAGRVEVYAGRLAGNQTPDGDTWGQQIQPAERLPIHAHSPPMNTLKNLGKLAPDLRYVHVLNWNRYRDLLPEVSGYYWASLDEDFSDYHVFDYREGPNALS
jgi:hypothetical protein